MQGTGAYVQMHYVDDLVILQAKRFKHLKEVFHLYQINVSKRDELKRPFENFHGPLGGAYKIRYALKNSPFWGGYMTDVIKDFAEKASKKMMDYLRENKSFEKENINSFLKELEDLESSNPTIIAFGNDAYSVLIRNLKEKLTKINQFIQEENEGLQQLTSKRSQVEKDADDVGNIVYGLRDKITEIDKVVADEASRIKSFKDSRSGSS